jgi:hypothetical protein
MIRPSGRDVVVFNDDSFGQLRQAAGVPDDFTNEGWSLEELHSGGGKGGCLMYFLGSNFIIKELNSEDHYALDTLAGKYFEHVSSGDSLLAAIYLHFEDLSTSRRFYVMRNVLGDGPFLAKYDLKGCNDDKTVELFGSKIQAARWAISGAGRWCGYAGPQDMCSYSAGKSAAAKADLVVTEGQREVVLGMIQRDTKWLSSMRLMDYSLIVGVKSGSEELATTRDCASSFGSHRFARGCSDGSQVAVCVGIIDFLQRWTLKKSCARVIKCMECNKATIPPAAYAARFSAHFEDRFVAAKPCLAMQKSIGKHLQCRVADDAEVGLVKGFESARLAPTELSAPDPVELIDIALFRGDAHQENTSLLDRETESPYATTLGSSHLAFC